MGRRYHFTSIDKRAEYRSIELRKDDNVAALLLLFIRGNALKVPYAFYNENNIGLVVGFLDEFMAEQKLATLTVFHPKLAAALREAKMRSFLKRTITREYVIGIDFHHQIDGKNLAHFQDGDGDCAFT
jgi:hypothetical protein